MPVIVRPIQYLVLTGTLYPDNRFEHRASYLSDNADLYQGDRPAPVVAELLDDAGNLLLRHSLPASTTCLDGETSRELRLRGALPFPPNTRSVQLFRNGARILDLRVSDRAPEVTLTWQPRQTVTGKQSITWQARHPDGLPVTCFVRYSHDDGERWQRVSTSTPESLATVDFDELPGGDRCRIVVVASAGVQTSVAESPSFAVPVKPVRAVILSPSDGATLAGDQAVALRGQGFDLEGHRPETHALLWRSSRDGELGQGMAVDLPGLSPGEHEIALIAGHGDRAGTATIRVRVLGPAGRREPAPRHPRRTADE